STSVWAERTSVVGESQLEAHTREWSRGASGATIHGVPVERVSSFRGGDWDRLGPGGKMVWSGAGLEGLSSGERKLYVGFRDDDSADGDYESPLKRRAARPAAPPTRSRAGTPLPAIPLSTGRPTG
ncbi:hypothetical protein HOY82DRAFT_459890, partial [Tuber indicum]